MIGIDTNILVRYLTRDDPAQLVMVDRALEDAAHAGDKLLVNPIVLCELVWVLETAYRYGRDEIATVLERILCTSDFEIPERDALRLALEAYRRDRGDFADYCIGRLNHRAGAEYTLTFDQHLKTAKDFRVLKP